jgi:hypothetical protein
MRKEIKAVGGKESALGSARFAKHILNVRFRQENVTLFPLDRFAKASDPILKLTRYQLYDLDGEGPSRNARRGDRTLPRVRRWVRRGNGPVQCDPEHARMQARLMKELEREYPRGQILRENEFVDVTVTTKTELILFEINQIWIRDLLSATPLVRSSSTHTIRCELTVYRLEWLSSVGAR